jgi:hypothetical protein
MRRVAALTFNGSPRPAELSSIDPPPSAGEKYGTARLWSGKARPRATGSTSRADAKSMVGC